MRWYLRLTALVASLLVTAWALPGCSSNEGNAGKMDGAMDKGKMDGGAMETGKMDGAMDKGKMDGGAMETGKMEGGKMEGGAMDKGKMDPMSK
jgi:uncharacterized protein involved in copper resistance